MYYNCLLLRNWTLLQNYEDKPINVHNYISQYIMEIIEHHVHFVDCYAPLNRSKLPYQ